MSDEGKASDTGNEKKSSETDNTTTPKKSNFPKKNAQYRGTGRLPCPELGENWTIEQIVRQQGKSAGRYDTYYYSPDGVKFRSKLRLQEFVKRDLDRFDYNTGKFLENNEEVHTSPSGKGKMSKIKTSELKTIDRTPNRVSVKSLGNQNRVKGPYSAALQMHARRKKVKSMKTQAAKSKNMSTSAAIRRAIAIVEKDNVEKLPYNLFKDEAMLLADHFREMGPNFDDLILQAWKCLTIESKKQYEQCSFFESSSKKSKEISRPLYSDGRRKRCGMCTGCLARNCGSCASCKDMKKFGGTGSKKQSCILRKCVAILSPKGPVTMVPQRSRTLSLSQMGMSSQSCDENFIPFPTGVLDYSPLIPHSSHSDGSVILPSQTRSIASDFGTSNSRMTEGVVIRDTHFGIPDNEDAINDVAITGEKFPSVGDNVELESGEFIHDGQVQSSSQKVHKRKSRVPVYIKQDYREQVDILVE